MADIDAIQKRHEAALDAANVATLGFSYGMGVTTYQWQRVEASAADVPALLARVRELEAQVQRVEALHRPHALSCCIEYGDGPCPTAAALRGSDV
ncbi:MAG: hypothetical protein INR66_14970 [Gordonia polyisoprenivorans]|nr:hypothetical protein [Gordonia polyisoprenivorans]